MSRIDFYHLQKQTLEDVLPKLLEKAYYLNKKILLRVGNDERVEFISSHLWNYDEQAFLPHGTKKDGNSEMQPIWITSDFDNPNGAVLLFLIDGAQIDPNEVDKFERIFNIFDGNSEDALNQARKFWKEFKSLGTECFYWQQDASGRWNQK